jgi:hypothetical protein
VEEKTEGLLNTEIFSHDLSTDGKRINNHTTSNFLSNKLTN